MTAINLACLKTQTARLGENFGNHMAFLRELHEILGFYTNRTMRSSQLAKRLSIPTYGTPLPILRLIEQELRPLANKFPQKGGVLVNELWKDGSLESRLLASRLIGMIPPSDAIPLLTHLPEWLAQTADKALYQSLLTYPFTRIRRENPDAFFILLEEWLNTRRSSMQIWGMQALMPLINDPLFDNLPSVFRILRPAILSAGPLTQIELQKCIIALEVKSTKEIISYLRDIVQSDPPLLLLRTLRRMLPAFSPPLQNALREQLRAVMVN